MHQPRFLARGLLASFLLIALLAAPGALSFTWAGAAAVEQAQTATGRPIETSTATSTAAYSPVGKFAGLRGAPLAACTGTVPLAQWDFAASSLLPTIGSGTLARQPEIPSPTYPSGNPDPSINFASWPTGLSADSGQFVEFDVSTQGRKNISLTFDYLSDSDGPALFDVYYYAGGKFGWQGFASGRPLAPGSWPAVSPMASIDFSTQSELNDNPSARFRIYPYHASTPGGTLSLDNITVSGACIPTATVTISGTTVVAGVTLTYLDGVTKTVTSGAGGAYSFTVPYNWTGTVTASKTGYTIGPPDHIDYPVPLTTDQLLQNYTATINRFTISGNAALPGVTLSYVDGGAQTATTGAGVTYTFTVPYGWTGTVTPSKTGYVFDPPHKDYTSVTANMSQDYTAAASCSASPVPARTVLINEVGWGGTLASTSDKWIELHNTDSLCPINLNGWQLIGKSNGGYAAFTITFSNANVIQKAGDLNSADYFVIVKYINTFHNVLENRVDSALNLLTYGETLYLRGPSGELVDTANCIDSTCNGDSSSYWPAGRSSPATSMERYLANPDTSENWVTYAGPTDPGDPTHPQTDRNTNVVHGTPGRINWAATNQPTEVPPTERVRRPTAIPPTPFAHMLINEFLPRAGTDWNHDGAVNVYDEFIEVKNLGPISVNLSSWKLDDAANPLDSYTLPSMTLKSGERAVFYRSTTQIPLADSGGTVRLINPSGVVFDARSYGPVASPDVSHCRIPDGFYWQLACFPTPGNENSLTGSAAVPPPIAFAPPPPCLVPDSAPEAFRLGECASYGAGLWNRKYWDDQAGARFFLVQDIHSKWKTIVK